jgi:diguanylate cyclase (GGDEF)-like protein
MPIAPRILLIEDDETDSALVRLMLTEIYGRSFELDWLTEDCAGLNMLLEQRHDIYLIDYRLGTGTGLDLIREATSRGCSAPMILLTTEDCPEVDFEAMKSGAVDYLIKGKVTTDQLARAIRYGINQKNVEKRLAVMAQQDMLTGLANRWQFNHRLKEALAHAKRTETDVALFMIDIDHFKEVNDSLGHPIGDRLLRGVSERLLSNVRETDTVARLSGDEFAVIATHLKDEDASCHMASKIIDAFKDPFHIEGNELAIGVSIGIATLAGQADHPTKMMANADIALYQAKRNGRQMYQVFDRDMHDKTEALRSLQTGLRGALDREEFTLYFQPKVHAQFGSVTGAEALLRWNHPERGIVSPAEIIPVAEATGLIVPAGRWILRAACRQILEWKAAGLPEIPVAVNVSAIQFKRPGLARMVAEAISDFGIRPELLELEITETAIMDGSTGLREVMDDLLNIGVRLSIDDFGTAYSSLAYLAELSVHTLKVDQLFVKGILSSNKHAAIAKTIISLGANLGLTVIAEGVETDEQLQWLRAHGCDQIQGYYFSRPMPGEDFVQWYKGRSKAIPSPIRRLGDAAHRMAATP